MTTRARGQSYTEYVIAVAAVIVGVLAMQVYVRRAVQAVVKDATDNMLRIEEEDVTGELTQERAMPRPVELLEATSEFSSSGSSDISGDSGGQTSSSSSTSDRTTTERYLELEGPLAGGSGGSAAGSRGGKNPWPR